MRAKKVKAYLAYINEQSFVGKVSEFSPPELKLKTGNYRAGEMLGEIDINLGVDKLEAEIVFEEISETVLNAFGICNYGNVRLRVMASEESEMCDFSQHEWVCVGHWISVKTDKLKSGDSVKSTCKLQVAEYTESRDGNELQHIDLARGIHRAGSQDLTARRRAALGLGY